MRVALVHDWLTGMRGGERCLEVFCELFPDADLYTLLHVPGSVAPVIERRRVVTSFIQRLPDAAKSYRRYLPLFPAAVRRFDLARVRPRALLEPRRRQVRPGAARRRPRVLLLHADALRLGPVRRLLQGTRGRARARGDAGDGCLRSGAGTGARRRASITSRRSPTSWPTASAAPTAASADVIYPPVDVSRFRIDESPGDFYLVVSALTPYKRVELAVEAASRLQRRLIVVGSGPEAESVRARAGSTVEFLGWRDDAEVAELYARCRALIFPTLEDFGIMPLEAMASGRPVIAFGRGGALETVVPPGSADPPTGLFFARQTADDLVDAIRDFESDPNRFEPKALRRRAESFDRPLFKERIRAYLDARLAGAATC